jgi:hypothetical protein
MATTTADVQSTSMYRHRHLTDGTWDSICLRCYATVANESDEHHLADFEAIHDCRFVLPGEEVQ